MLRLRRSGGVKRLVGIMSRRLPASKRCDGQGGLRSVVARVATATGQLQKAATNAASTPAVWVTLTGSRELQNRGSARE
jgi:hypothetical protein